jgi:mRNA interferase RelE/StbE
MDTAIRELERLDKPAGRRIAARIRWLSANLDSVKPDDLAGDLAGLYKLRVGDYRVVYEIVRDEECIVVHAVGHRREIYRT